MSAQPTFALRASAGWANARRSPKGEDGYARWRLLLRPTALAEYDEIDAETV